VGVWGMGPTPQSPIPNPQSPIPKYFIEIVLKYYYYNIILFILYIIIN